MTDEDGDSGSGPAGGGTGRGEARREARARARRRSQRSDPGSRQRPRGPRRSGEKESPEPVGGLVGRLFEKWGIAEKVERAAAVSDWDEIVGARIAEATGEVRVSGRTLFVEVKNASWMQELDMMRHTILSRLNEGRDRGRIEKIVFLQGGKRRDGSEDSHDRRGRR